jgi:hypothetical protein
MDTKIFAEGLAKIGEGVITIAASFAATPAQTQKLLNRCVSHVAGQQEADNLAAASEIADKTVTLVEQADVEDTRRRKAKKAEAPKPEQKPEPQTALEFETPEPEAPKALPGINYEAVRNQAKLDVVRLAMKNREAAQEINDRFGCRVSEVEDGRLVEMHTAIVTALNAALKGA